MHFYQQWWCLSPKLKQQRNCPVLPLKIQVDNHPANKELKLLANQNTFSRTVYSLVWSKQEEPFATEKHLSCVYVAAAYLYTHIYQGIWGLEPTDRCVLNQGSAQTAQMAPHPPGPANTSLRLFTFTAQCQDSRQEDSRSHPLWRGCTTYLKVVRWQKNEETLGTAAAASQRLPGHPHPARTHSVCVYWDTSQN